MKKDLRDLKNTLKSTVLFFSNDSKFSISVLLKLKSKINTSKINNFLLYINKADVYFSDIEYCAITIAFKEAAEEEFSDVKFVAEKQTIYYNLLKELEVENWFTEQEIESSNLLYSNPQKNNSNTIEIEGVVEVIPGFVYDCPKTSIRNLVDWYQKGISIYNFDTQRSPKITEKYGDLIYEPSVNSDSVNSIAKDVIDGTFKYNHVVYNILNTGMEKYDYNSDTKILKFTRDKGSQMNIIDGYHRHEGFVKALLENPDCQHYSGLTITNYTVEQALEFVGQESKANKISEARAKSADNTSSAELVRKLNSEGNKNNNVLFDKISVTEEEITKYYSKYVKFDIFTVAIEENFSDILNKPLDIMKVKTYLQNFFNIVIGNFEEDFNNIKESKEKKATCHQNMFFGYIKLARVLYNDPDWETKLLRTLQIIDFSLENNKIWEDSRIKSSKIRVKNKNILYSYIEKISTSWSLKNN